MRQRCVAVKRLLMTVDFNDKMFQDQIKILMMAPHKNIVKFLGYSYNTEVEVIELQGELVMVERREKLLCFEYLRNGDLDQYVSDASSGLEWRERYQIIKGICECLHYLHGKSIVHLELKPQNVLLDDNMVPKIAGFCLSRHLGENQCQTTQNLSGSRADMAQECMNTRVTKFKSDIYGLGFIITMLLAGRKGLRNGFLETDKVRNVKPLSETTPFFSDKPSETTPNSVGNCYGMKK
ncbi:hypothetical protein HU200_039929 [Digitaria exilis]|uniref:Protein kinase domain-containing protein n=1 Tax=Digitaria exilis TaxID=1010633 RepID=A0A835B9N2_9POAL|nr:hypothetical protein HU200_039929 [Digitaria exilis]